jgi:hypothetical protein
VRYETVSPEKVAAMNFIIDTDKRLPQFVEDRAATGQSIL